MLYYTLQFAKESKYIEKIYVSTDSEEIEDYAMENKVEVIRRGRELGGETPVVAVYVHALEVLDNPSIKYVVGIQADHPDRSVKLDEAIEYLVEKDSDELITVDGQGFVNGSMKIMKADALLGGRIAAVSTIMDDCTNIHYLNDLKTAESNLLKMENR